MPSGSGAGHHACESLGYHPENLIDSVESDEHTDREDTRYELHHPGRL
jgi:hypothetical protein